MKILDKMEQLLAHIFVLKITPKKKSLDAAATRKVFNHIDAKTKALTSFAHKFHIVSDFLSHSIATPHSDTDNAVNGNTGQNIIETVQSTLDSLPSISFRTRGGRVHAAAILEESNRIEDIKHPMKLKPFLVKHFYYYKNAELSRNLIEADVDNLISSYTDTFRRIERHPPMHIQFTVHYQRNMSELDMQIQALKEVQREMRASSDM